MLKITVNEIVLNQLRQAFPTPPNSAKKALDKYVALLEQMINDCLQMGRTELARKLNAYDISVERLRNSESPRELWRLQTLRRWSHEQEIKPFFT